MKSCAVEHRARSVSVLQQQNVSSPATSFRLLMRGAGLQQEAVTALSDH